MKTKVHTKLTFAEILEDAIANSPYSKTDIANKLGVSKGTVSNWVNNIRKPDIDTVVALCYLLNLDIFYTINATIPEGELYPSEQELLLLYRQLQPYEKDAVLGLMRALAGKKKGSSRNAKKKKKKT